MKLVECVPNFSEGRDKDKVAKIVEAAKSAGVTILDVEIDADHHRCVLSFVGAPDNCVEACFRVAKASSELIDLTAHKGEHPRMGAVDVIPFIPVAGVTIEDCQRVSHDLSALLDVEDEWAAALDLHRPRFAVLYEDNFNYLSKMCLLRMRAAAHTMCSMARARGCVVIVAGADATDHAELYLAQGAENSRGPFGTPHGLSDRAA